MLHKDQIQCSDAQASDIQNSEDPLGELQSGCGEEYEKIAKNVWFNMLTGIGYVSLNSARADTGYPQSRSLTSKEVFVPKCSSIVSGGMLCDEPGLG